MKKIIILLMMFILSIYIESARALDTSNSENGADIFSRGFSDQKQISGSKFEKTVKEMKERALTKKQKRIKEMVQPNEPVYDNEHLRRFALEENEEGLSLSMTVMIPVKAYNDEGKYILPGYYKLSCRKIAENRYVLDLSQGTSRIMTVKAYQTEQDLEQETIRFCSARVMPEGIIRLVYGTIDLNLEGNIYY